jgi:hypothetical protein
VREPLPLTTVPPLSNRFMLSAPFFPVLCLLYHNSAEYGIDSFAVFIRVFRVSLFFFRRLPANLFRFVKAIEIWRRIL